MLHDDLRFTEGEQSAAMEIEEQRYREDKISRGYNIARPDPFYMVFRCCSKLRSKYQDGYI